MPNNTFRLHILAPDKPFYDGECISLVLPTVDGKYGIMANHSNTIAAIVTGELSYRTPDGKERFAAVSEGMVKIEDNDVLVLVETIERPDEIDINRARAAADAAREAMLQKLSKREYLTAKITLAKAVNRLNVKEHTMGGDSHSIK